MRKIILTLLAVALILTPVVSSIAENDELVRNGVFESSGSQLWLDEAWESDYIAKIDTLQDGNECAYISSSIENDVRLYQEIKTEPNTIYKLTCKVKTNNVEGGNGANISVNNSFSFSAPITGTNDWQEVTLVGKTGADQISMPVCVRLGGYSSTSKGEAWFDDFSAKKLDNASGYTVADFSDFSTSQNNVLEPAPQDTQESSSSAWIYIAAAAIIAIVAVLIIMNKKHKAGGAKKVSDPLGVDTPTFKKNKSVPESIQPLLDDPQDVKLRLSKRDWFLCVGLTIVYSVVALLNLGSLLAPESIYRGQFGDKFTITFESQEQLSEIWAFTGIDNGTIMITSDDGNYITYKIEDGNMFRWKKLDNAMSLTAKTLTVEVTSGKAWINELAFFGTDKKLLKATASLGAEMILDEQNTIPEVPSYYNGMYFDEFYHARTSYEHLNNLYPYEWTHPPLGKLFISIGIAIFGMNAFGWRIIGTLFGIAMVPIMYCFAKRLFKKWQYAFITAALFAFDFMHFAQTRIATIDVYGVFFIILMYYYMYQYYCMSFYTHGVKKTLRPLALAGLFFGLGAASKWICFYAGAGLAVILLLSFIKRYKEYKKLIKSKSKKERELGAEFASNVLYTVLWCCCFFILIPFIIYFLAYIPVYKYYGCMAEGQGFMTSVKSCFDRFVLEQERMFEYHSQLKADHSYSSPWYSWPFISRPVWYYIGYYPGTSDASTISGMGNPAVWWVSSIGSVMAIGYLIIDKFRKWLNDKSNIMDAPNMRLEKKNSNDALTVLLVGIAANYLPWMLITRCVFQYHFFATVPFIIMTTMWLIKKMDERFTSQRWVKWAWLGLTLILFVVFYPIISGYRVPIKYIDSLQWLKTWSFRGY